MKIVIYSIAILLVINSCKTQDKKSNQASGNHLIHESSPYLLQHAHNPVDWYPWADEALQKAKKERKLMLISIGYSSCHWCHVMERESFTDTTVSRILNEDFVSIKVDREERPDVDNVYMTACQVINRDGGCGWPLNAIALSDGRPVWVGTYLTKDEFLKLLGQIQELYEEDVNELEKMAMQIENHLVVDHNALLLKEDLEFETKTLSSLNNRLIAGMDDSYGGKKGDLKFPLPCLQRYLLQIGHLQNNQDFLKQSYLSLNQMKKGALYDHLDGGFSRYSTDPYWKVPHFEKMLYDNGQLISLYSYAYQKTKNDAYKNIIDQSLNFIQKIFTSPEGGFYSSMDAETEGIEGKYYVWTEKEINDLSTNEEDKKIFKEYYDIKSNGNWEKGMNVLAIKTDAEKLASKFKKTNQEIQSIINSYHLKLLEVRKKREAPNRDDKILCSWNAMMIRAYADAYAATGNTAYLESAKKAAEFIQNKMTKTDSSLYRNYMNGKANINAFLDDYAFTIDAFIRLYEVCFDERWLNHAFTLCNYTIANFSDENQVFFYYNSKLDQELIARKMELEDQVTPSSNSVMADNLHRLGLYYYHQPFLDRSKKMVLSVVKNLASADPIFYSNWLRVYSEYTKPLYEVAIVGENAGQVQAQMIQHFIPQAILLGGKNEGSLELLKEKLQEGKTYIYVCRNKVCKIPVEEVSAAIKLMN
ncbi:MAG: thioredoxin domain-containing protein [Bacteroidota bacterium]|nr:thioredoxin domain-containing protein [Bacteroidota bacterium]